MLTTLKDIAQDIAHQHDAPYHPTLAIVTSYAVDLHGDSVSGPNFLVDATDADHIRSAYAQAVALGITDDVDA